MQPVTTDVLIALIALFGSIAAGVTSVITGLATAVFLYIREEQKARLLREQHEEDRNEREKVRKTVVEKSDEVHSAVKEGTEAAYTAYKEANGVNAKIEAMNQKILELTEQLKRKKTGPLSEKKD